MNEVSFTHNDVEKQIYAAGQGISGLKEALPHLPTRRQEAYKYSDLRNTLTSLFPKVTTPPQVQEQKGKLICANGFLFGEIKGILIKDLSLPSPKTPLEALNAAFSPKAYAITISKEFEGVLPIHYAADNAFTVAPHIQIEIAEGAKVFIEETFEGEGIFTPYLSINVGKFAVVKHIIFNAHFKTNLATQRITLSEKATYKTLCIQKEHNFSRRELFIDFTGEESFASLKAITLTAESGHADITLNVNHGAAHCQSEEVYRYALFGESRGVFQGKIYVANGAQKTDSQMKANALLLSDDAEFNAKPELEIYADDVICAHGATAGDLDEDLLFYLKARGLSEKEARGLLIKAFLSEVLEGWEDNRLEETLENLLQEALHASN